MAPYLWHFDPDGLPLRRLDTLTGQQVPAVASGRREELASPGYGGRPMACSIPLVSGCTLSRGLGVFQRHGSGALAVAAPPLSCQPGQRYG